MRQTTFAATTSTTTPTNATTITAVIAYIHAVAAAGLCVFKIAHSIYLNN